MRNTINTMFEATIVNQKDILPATPKIEDLMIIAAWKTNVVANCQNELFSNLVNLVQCCQYYSLHPGQLVKNR